MERALSRRQMVIEGWGVLMGVPALFCVAWFLPRFPRIEAIPTCAVRHFLGVPCPGCGLTTAFIALMRGEIRTSIDAHPLGIIIALWLVSLFGRALFAVIVGRWPRTLLTQGQRDFLIAVFLGALILQWAVHLVIQFVR